MKKIVFNINMLKKLGSNGEELYSTYMQYGMPQSLIVFAVSRIVCYALKASIFEMFSGVPHFTEEFFLGILAF